MRRRIVCLKNLSVKDAATQSLNVHANVPIAAKLFFANAASDPKLQLADKKPPSLRNDSVE
jgi:hypothetical protein